MEGYIKIEDFIDYLKMNDLVIAPRSVVELNETRTRLLNRRWLKVSHIKKGGFWDVKSRDAIINIIKSFPKSEYRLIDGKKPYYEVSKQAVIIEAKRRGVII